MNTETDKKAKRFRVNIPFDEGKAWGPQDVPQSLVRHWIELGRERYHAELSAADRALQLDKRLEGIEEELAELQNANTRLANLLLQTSRLLSVISTLPHFELEVLKKKAAEGGLSGADRNRYTFLQIKEENFLKYSAKVFPEHKTSEFLATKTNRDEDA